MRELHPTIGPLRDPRPLTHENLVGNDHPSVTRVFAPTLARSATVCEGYSVKLGSLMDLDGSWR